MNIDSRLLNSLLIIVILLSFSKSLHNLVEGFQHPHLTQAPVQRQAGMGEGGALQHSIMTGGHTGDQDNMLYKKRSKKRRRKNRPPVKGLR